MVRRIGLGLALALAGLALLFALALAMAQTGPGQRLIAAGLERALSGPETRAEVEGLRGTVPFDMALARVELIGPEGPWLRVEDARLDWSPGALLRGRLHVEELSARRIEVLRPPPNEVEKDEPPTPVRLPELPDTLFPTTIERLLVDELFIAEALLGEPATFRLAGSLDTGPAGEVATVALDLERTDQPTAQASLDARLELQPPALEIVASAAETGDLLAAMTGRPEAGDFRLELTGSGPLGAWTGRLEAVAENLLRAQAEVGIAAVDQPRLAFDLTLEPAPGLVPEDLAPLLGERVTVTARLTQPAAQPMVVEELRAEAALAALHGAGRFDFDADQIALRGALDVADLGPLRAIVDMPLAGALRLDIEAEGAVLQPQGRIEVTFTDLAAADMRARRIETAADWRVLAPLTRTLAISLAGEGRASGVDLATDPPLPVEDWSWQFQAGAPADGPLRLEDFTLTGGPIRLAATGELDLEIEQAALDLVLDLSDLAPLSQAWDQAIGGRLELTAALRVPEGGDLLQAQISGVLDELQGLPPGAAELLGARVTLAGSGSWEPDVRVQASELEIETAHLQLTGDLGLELPQHTLSGDLLLTLPELQALEPVLGQPVGGSLRLAATVGGTPDAPEALLEARSAELLIAEQVLGDVRLRLTASDLLEAPQGSVQLGLSTMGLATSLQGRYQLEEEQLRLDELVLQVPGARAEGALAADLATGLVDGRLQGRVQEISRLEPLLPIRARGRLGFDLRLAPENGAQSATLSLDGQEVRTEFGAVRRLGLEASVTDVLGEPQIQASAEIATLQREDLRLDRAEIEASGSLDAFTLTAALEGEATVPFSVQTSGEVALAEAVTVRLAELTGQIADEPVRLLTPAEIRLAEEMVEAAPLRLSWGQAELAGEFRMATDQVAADLRVAGLPLEALTRFGAPDLIGRADATLTLSGSPADPRGELRIDIADLTSPEAALAELPPLRVTTTAQLGAERLSIEARASGVTATPMTLTASLPANVQLQPFVFELPPDGALEGQFAARMNLARIDDLIGLDDQRLQGDLAVDLTLSGTIAEPGVNGTIAVDNGLYENGLTGTVLRQITLRADAGRQQIAIRELSATDGGQGRVTGGGTIGIDAAENYPYELQLQLRDARLVRREDIDATISGRTQLAGDLSGADLTGRLRVERAEVSIAETPGPTIAVLDVEEVGGPAGPVGAGGPANGVEAPFQTRLDVAVEIPGQVFVRGRGLDSEWGGQLTVRGTAEEPILVGTLTIRRGHFDFIDRRFVLREGQIEFTGDFPPTPFIYLEAVATAQDITAIVRLEGPATAPSITIDSEPPLPQDEVLARLLFNRPLSEVGPADAVRLAAAVNRLRTGTGFDVFAEIRNVVGLDVLDITTAEDGDGVVRAGRYLGDDVYLEVERGVAEGTGRARVEIEVLPGLALEAETGGAADTGVGLKWKYDF